MIRRFLVATVALAALAVPGRASAAELIYGLTQTNALVAFASDAPGLTAASVPVTGLPAGETLVAIDFRPSGSGNVYALGSSNRLYTVEPATGAATAVGSSGAFTLSGTSFGFDFNPAVDRIRVVSDADQNLRLNPADGTLSATDTALAYNLGDPHAGADPAVVAAAYDNSFVGTAGTTLFALDSATDALVSLETPNPNSGVLTTRGAFGTDVPAVAGLDISPAGNAAYALLTSGTTSTLYSVNLATGAGTPVGPVGGGAVLADIAVARQVPRALVLDSTNQLLGVDPAAPGTVLSTTPVTGLPAAEGLQGIDVRPATGELLALGSAVPNRVYRVDSSTGAATAIGSPGGFALAGTAFGMDVNPVTDGLRVTSDLEQNLRINLSDGTSTTDVPLTYAAGDSNFGTNPAVFGSAYSNNAPGATTTTLYDLDAQADTLVIQNPPNTGFLNTVGAAGVNLVPGGGFDIAGQDGTAYAAIQRSGDPSSSLSRVNLATGALAQPQAIGQGVLLARGLALLPPGTVSVGAAEVREGAGPAMVTVSRSAFASGFAAVRFSTSDDTAKAGSDYTGTTQLVAFAPGELKRTVAIPVADDTVAEGDETVGLAITAATGNPTLAPASAKLTIHDNDTGTPPPPPPGADKTAPRISLTIGSRAKVRTVLRRGLRPRIRVNEAASVVVQLRRAARVVGRASAKLSANRSRIIVVRIARRERAKLRRAQRTRITVRVIATDAAGNRAVKRKDVSVRR